MFSGIAEEIIGLTEDNKVALCVWYEEHLSKKCSVVSIPSTRSTLAGGNDEVLGNGEEN